MRFEVLGKIKGKDRPRFSRMGKHTYTPSKTKEYEFLVKLAFMKSFPWWKCSDKPMRLKITAIFTVPKSTSRVKAEKMLNGQILPTKKPDADNIAKIVCDALNKVAYIDDRQVVEQSTIKKYGTEEKVIVDLEEI